MNTRIITLAILTAILLLSSVFVLPSSLLASPTITGTYSGKLSYKEGVPFGPQGFCYSESQVPTLDFTLKKVRVRGNVISGKYDNGTSKGADAKGKRNSSGFKVSIRYGRFLYYHYYFVYTAVVSKIKASKAQVVMSGITYLGESVSESGCRYKYSGTVKHK